MKIFHISLVSIVASIALFLSISPVSAKASQIACTMEYAPVCGSVQVQCITAPCNPVRQTFSNSCMASASDATNITTGECATTTVPPIVGGDQDAHGCIGSAGYSWIAIENKCVRPWESSKMTSRQAIQAGIWQIESFNNKPISSSGTITFSKNTFSAKLCNSMSGQYGTLDGVLIFRKVMSTKMHCDTDIMTVENALHFARAKFIVGVYNLTITTKKGDVIVWKRK